MGQTPINRPTKRPKPHCDQPTGSNTLAMTKDVQASPWRTEMFPFGCCKEQNSVSPTDVTDFQDGNRHFDHTLDPTVIASSEAEVRCATLADQVFLMGWPAIAAVCNRLILAGVQEPGQPSRPVGGWNGQRPMTGNKDGIFSGWGATSDDTTSAVT